MVILLDKKNMRFCLALLLSIIIVFISSFQTSKSIHTIQYNHDTASFDNEYVIVYKDTSLLNDGNNRQIKNRILVALSDITTIANEKKVQLSRGSIMVFKENEIYSILSGEYFEIGIKKNHPNPALPKIWHEPAQNNIVYDDNDFRVFEERLAPHHDRDLHSHLERLVVRLNTVHLTDPRYYPNGQEGKGIQNSNTIKFAEPVEHVVRNLSDIPLFNIVIEFKHK